MTAQSMILVCLGKVFHSLAKSSDIDADTTLLSSHLTFILPFVPSNWVCEHSETLWNNTVIESLNELGGYNYIYKQNVMFNNMQKYFHFCP